MEGLVCASRYRLSGTIILCCRVCSAHKGLRHYNSGDGNKSLTLSSINANLRDMRYEVRGRIPKRADEIKMELAAVRIS